MPSDPIIVAAIWGFMGVALGAIFGALATTLIGLRSLRASGVTAERTKWRDKVRELAGKLHDVRDDASNDKLWRELALNLNPFDDEDKKLISLAKRFPRNEAEQGEVTGRIAYLLKHDWDRAKRELAFSFRASPKRQLYPSQSRITAPPQPHIAAAPG